MNKKSKKKKCPSCGKISVVVWFEDCVFCGGGEYYYCESCDSSFHIGKKGKIGEEV